VQVVLVEIHQQVQVLQVPILFFQLSHQQVAVVVEMEFQVYQVVRVPLLVLLVQQLEQELQIKVLMVAQLLMASQEHQQAAAVVQVHLEQMVLLRKLVQVE
jgi:hypothetical protein